MPRLSVIRCIIAKGPEFFVCHIMSSVFFHLGGGSKEICRHFWRARMRRILSDVRCLESTFFQVCSKGVSGKIFIAIQGKTRDWPIYAFFDKLIRGTFISSEMNACFFS